MISPGIRKEFPSPSSLSVLCPVTVIAISSDTSSIGWWCWQGMVLILFVLPWHVGALVTESDPTVRGAAQTANKKAIPAGMFWRGDPVWPGASSVPEHRQRHFPSPSHFVFPWPLCKGFGRLLVCAGFSSGLSFCLVLCS